MKKFTKTELDKMDEAIAKIKKNQEIQKEKILLNDMMN